MARRSSKKSLKDEKPYWYCIPTHVGSILELAQTGKNLTYVTDPRDVADIWKYLGNPKFRSEYSYLLIGYTPDGHSMNEVYAVKLPAPEKAEDARAQKKSVAYGHFSAFEGTVDKICFGWTTKMHAKHILETGKCCTGANVPRDGIDLL